jgi:RNA polymerase sigma-70 factor, ECF subfamily
MDALITPSAAPLCSALTGALKRLNSSDDCAVAVERVLEVVVRAARQRWPLLRVDAVGYVRHLARNLSDDRPLREALEALATDDLYLAFGCLSRDRAALAAFDAHFLGEVGPFVARVSAASGFVEDVQQALRDKLLGGRPGEPGIAAYSGRGSLGGWVRIAALRVALNLQRSMRRKTTHEAAAASVKFDTSMTPELAYLHEHYREPFTAALRMAIAGLSDRDRVLMRLYHREGVALEALAALHRVHVSTVSRWLTCAREQVAEATLRTLRERLSVGPSEAESIAALVLKQLDVSLLRYLGGES